MESPFSSTCSLMREAWYSVQASTDSAFAFCIAWLMLSSLVFDTAMNTVSMTTVMATRLLRRRSSPSVLTSVSMAGPPDLRG